MLALCSVLHPTDYAKNYAGIMGTDLTSAEDTFLQELTDDVTLSHLRSKEF